MPLVEPRLICTDSWQAVLAVGECSSEARNARTVKEFPARTVVRLVVNIRRHERRYPFYFQEDRWARTRRIRGRLSTLV